MNSDELDQELILALLSCPDEWQQVTVLRLFGKDEQAEQLANRLLDDETNKLLRLVLSKTRRV